MHGKICKKVGHYTSCVQPKCQRRPPRGTQNNSTQQKKPQQTRRSKHITQDVPESDQTEESVDAEGELYIKELNEDWANINLIRPTEFIANTNDAINKEFNGEFRVGTTTRSRKLQWLANTGSPTSFINQHIAQQLQKEIPNAKISAYTENTIYKCFNKNNIDMKGVLTLDIKSGFWTAKAFKVLIVTNRTNNIMGRDILAKLGINSARTNKPVRKLT